MTDPINPEKATLAWTIPWGAGWVTSVTFLGASRRLAAGNHRGQLFVWDLPASPSGSLKGPVYRLDGHSNEVSALAATPDGRWLISASYDHTVRLWDMQAPPKGSETVTLGSKDEAKPNRPATEGPSVRVELMQASRILDVHQEWVRTLALSADGTRLLTGDDRGLAVLWEMPAPKEIGRLQVGGFLAAVALSRNGAQAVTCEFAPRKALFTSATKLWDLATGKPNDLGKSFTKGTRVAGMRSAAFSADDKLLALGEGGETDGKARVFLAEATTGKGLREMASHLNGVTGVAFHPDGKHLASCGRDTTVRLWQAADGKQVKELGKPRGGQTKDWIHAIAFSADGNRLAAADMIGQIQVWSFA
jgi:WD40 repeat protein